ncbi:hypothetical protein CRG98_044419 [Punica granatum]|uniref:Uncharacterized protein n=1 Tax=Punica granatum TaxID=22663 RepID=A0A2I0HTV2_PUNGR|nr:hypothetical protein CRG98_044419 [Punica granatum]
MEGVRGEGGSPVATIAIWRNDFSSIIRELGVCIAPVRLIVLVGSTSCTMDAFSRFDNLEWY